MFQSIDKIERCWFEFKNRLFGKNRSFVSKAVTGLGIVKTKKQQKRETWRERLYDPISHLRKRKKRVAVFNDDDDDDDDDDNNDDDEDV